MYPLWAPPLIPRLFFLGILTIICIRFWDKFHHGSIGQNSRPTSLSRLLDEVGLCDIWRVQFPTTKQYSCYCASHHALSWIDLAIGSTSILLLVAGVEYLPRSVSDHSPLRVQLTLGLAVGSPTHSWRLNKGLIYQRNK